MRRGLYSCLLCSSEGVGSSDRENIPQSKELRREDSSLLSPPRNVLKSSALRSLLGHASVLARDNGLAGEVKELDDERSFQLGEANVGSHMCLTAKDFLTARQLLQHVRNHMSAKSEEIVEFLWELALKLRVQASDVRAVVIIPHKNVREYASSKPLTTTW